MKKMGILNDEPSPVSQGQEGRNCGATEMRGGRASFRPSPGRLEGEGGGALMLSPF